ncbi:MAG: zinc metalloprotease HtpX [Bdellovibrionota bacterium]
MFFNWMKTAVLLALLSGLLLFVGNYLGGQQGLTIALGMAFLMNFASYWFSDKIVLAMYGAKPISETDAPGLHKLVEELSARAGIPKPRLYLMQTHVPNAFATGRNPAHGVVAVTTGLLQTLDRRELGGVLAHELSHIKHYDTLIATMAATIAAAISYLGHMLYFFGGRGGSDRDDRPNPGIALAMMIVAPFIAGLIQMAVSRSREYAADERGARIAGEAGALASALRKLQAAAHARPFAGAQATEHLFIVNPFRGLRGFQLFSTHPSTEERVRRLEALAAELGG